MVEEGRNFWEVLEAHREREYYNSEGSQEIPLVNSSLVPQKLLYTRYSS